MATLRDVLAAIDRIEKAGYAGEVTRKALLDCATPLLSPSDYDVVLDRLRGAFPQFFPASPPGPEQQGHGAAAMKNAEVALSQQQSAAAEFDRQMIEAILHAHIITDADRKQLNALEAEIESAARTWDLSTPEGAREFQRFLLGKLYQIIDVVERVNDDDTSKKALTSALAALYASVPAGDNAPGGGDAATADTPQPDAAQPVGFPDTDTDSGLDTLPAEALGSDGEHPPARGAASAPAMMTGHGAGEGLPGAGAMPAGAAPGALPLPGWPQDLQRRSAPQQFDDQALLADDTVPAEETSFDPPDDEHIDDTEPASEPDSTADATRVILPDGDTVTAATPQLAAVMQAAVSGTPIADAFHQQGMTIPPPGTAVAGPIDPSRVSGGDIGMFTDRHALALGNSKALLDGQIQYIGNVRGPSFLGWQHPPTAAGATEPTPPPTPIRPSATVRV
jgi:hypothetical protein